MRRSDHAISPERVTTDTTDTIYAGRESGIGSVGNPGGGRITLDNDRSREFGRHLHRIRTEVFDESLREFGKRAGLSASYIGKVENGEVGVPKRSTIEDLARRLAMKPDALLLKAGYVPDDPQRNEDDEYLLMLLGQLNEGERAAVRAYIQHVKDQGIVRQSPKRVN